MSYGDPFETLKARYCAVAIVIAWYWQPGNQALTELLSVSEWYWIDLVYHYYAHGTTALFIIVAAMVGRLSAGHLLGHPLTGRHLPLIVLVAVLTYCASLTIVDVIFIPASYLLPDFVTWWLAWLFQPVVYLAADGTFPIGANILSFISLVVLAPVLEEFLFRGYLLHRWSRKWGLWPGVLLSSAAFGAVHPDTLAVAATGLGLALLYLKTQTLWAPIVSHSILNFSVWLWDYCGVLSEGNDYYAYTIEQLREDWWYGAIALLILVLLIDQILRRNEPLGPFVLPVLEGKDA